MTTRGLLLLKPDQLLTHPRNMRRFYPPSQVKEMADSIAANGGVVEPLIVVRDDKHGKWLVVDGNMRLAGAKFLGKGCPPLECKVIGQTEAEQMLTMITANQVRYDVDPVSEALHYKALRDQGMTVRQIADKTGVYEARIHTRILLADLEEPIQKLIAEGKLPADQRVAKGLLSLTPAVRTKLASRLADNPNIKIQTIVNACERLRKDRPAPAKLKRPAVELSFAQHGTGKVAAKAIRGVAKRVCQDCNQVEEKLREGDEPAWSMLVHAADKTCGGCAVRDLQDVCKSCPAVDLLRKLVAMKGGPDGK